MSKHIRNILILLLMILTVVSMYHSLRSNPLGTGYKSPVYSIAPNDIDFLYDLTFVNEEGDLTVEQQIFDRIFFLIDNAQRYILIDMFLFNSFAGKEDKAFRELADEMTQRLVQKKLVNPGIKIDFITDPVNTVYGGAVSRELESLAIAGINVINTDLHSLRDSNLIYSPLWRLFFQWFKNSNKGGIFSHPFSSNEIRITLRSYLDMLNFKANHRKIFFADYKDAPRAIVTSANPHNGSSAHSNVAFEIAGPLAMEIYRAEMPVAKFSGASLYMPDFYTPSDRGSNTGYSSSARLLTEDMIRDALIEHIEKADIGDHIDIGVFYLSHHGIIASLLNASERGVGIRIILDPNRDAFGREKNGIPNRQTAHKLLKKSDKKIEIRWYDTHGEQYHSKLAHFTYRDHTSAVILGSANFTRRNLDNYNLEANILFIAPSDNPTIIKAEEYFEKIWSGDQYTARYSKYKDDSFFKGILAFILETTGTSTF